MGGALLFAGCAAPASKSDARREASIPPTQPASVAPAAQPREENDDGEWVISWLLNHWNLNTPAHEHVAAFERCRAAGYTPEEGLLTVLPPMGLWSYARLGNWGDLQRQLGFNCPVLVQLLSGSGRRRTRQFLFVTAVNATGDRVMGRLADGEEYNRDINEFLSRWRLTHFWMLTACPPEAAQWKMRTPERMSLMRHYELIGRNDQAEIEGNRALVSDPANPDVLNGLGVRAMKRGDVDEAERFFRQAIGADSRHVRALNNLAFLLVENNRSIEEAGALARRAVLLEPTNPRALDTHALVLIKREQWSDARPLLERAWDRSGRLPMGDRMEIGLRLARVYLRLGERALACRTVKALRALDSGLALPEELHGACIDS